MAPVSRRSFLAGLIAAPVLTQAVSVAAAPSDAEHQVGSWCVRWMDWRYPVNQHVKFGYWFAYLPPSTRIIDTGDMRHWVSPTTGVLQRCRDFQIIDTSRLDDSWPIGLTEPESAFTAAKARAYTQLVKVLR